MTPTPKKRISAEELARVFDEAPLGAELSEEERAALREAEENPRWIRLTLEEALERLSRNRDQADE